VLSQTSSKSGLPAALPWNPEAFETEDRRLSKDDRYGGAYWILRVLSSLADEFLRLSWSAIAGHLDGRPADGHTGERVGLAQIDAYRVIRSDPNAARQELLCLPEPP
jgi:hypothetical protein